MVTREPASVARAEVPPLCAGLLFAYHLPVRTSAGFVSSTRPVVAVRPPGTGAPFSMSNASIQTHDPSVLFPRSWVISIESVWGPAEGPLAGKSGVWYRPGVPYESAIF